MKLYVLNLKRRPDRWQQIQSELAKVKHVYEVERIEAVDGQQIDTAQLQQMMSPATIEGLGKVRPTDATIGSLGAIGCYLSHYKAWQHILINDEPGLVAEDDLRLKTDIKALEPTWKEYDFVVMGYLEDFVKPKPKKKPKQQEIQPFRGSFLGTHLYYVTPKAAAILLTHAFPISVQVDSYVSQILQQQSQKVGICVPSVADQRISATDIQTPTRSVLFLIVPVVVVLLLLPLLILWWKGKGKKHGRSRTSRN